MAAPGSTWPNSAGCWPSTWICRCAPSARPVSRGTTARRSRPTPCPRTSAGANAAVQTLGVDLRIVPDIAGADLVHSHTWYANMAGHIASLLHGIPHVLSAHSLEPLRPWKAEQLGGGYALSSWVEKTAYEAAAAIIAVSEGMRQDILRSYPDVDPAKVKVVHNGIDVEPLEPGRGRRRRPRPGHRPGPAERGLRGPQHPPEGRAVPAPRGRQAARRRPAGAVPRRRGHPRARGRNRPPDRGAADASAAA